MFLAATISPVVGIIIALVVLILIVIIKNIYVVKQSTA